MQLNGVLLESLLHQEEGPALDFKQDQYPFGKGSTSEIRANLKSELVKDILAMANASREMTAYILIGVEEIKGGRSRIVGVQNHLDDADLHQLINTKTQRPVEFSYFSFPYKGSDIGVIEIPVQDRFLYLTQDYGKLHENAVYIRDGSSTRTATPAEVIELSTPKAPMLDLDWADFANEGVVHSPYTVQSLILEPLLDEDTFQPASQPTQYWYGVDLSTFSTSRPNPDYSKELILYTLCTAFFKPLGLWVHNKSGVTGKRIRFEGSITKRDGLAVVDDQPKFPKEFPVNFASADLISLANSNEPTMEFSDDRERWNIHVEFGDVRPDEQILTYDTLWFGSRESKDVRLEGRLLGDNLPEPIKCELELRFESECRPMSIDDVEFYKRAHFEALGYESE